MTTTFNLLDEIFFLFINDDELLKLLSITDKTNNDMITAKIRKKKRDATVITKEMFDFIDMSFVNTRRTNNFLVNHGILEFNIYCVKESNVGLIYDRINKILKANYEDMQVLAEGHIACVVESAYAYRIRYQPQVNS